MPVLTQGESRSDTALRTAIRDRLKTFVTHGGVSQDATAFAASQTVIDPAGDVAADRRIEAASRSDVSETSFDAAFTIEGDTEMTGRTIRTVSVLSGPARGDVLTRTVLATGVGVQAGDALTVRVRVGVTANPLA